MWLRLKSAALATLSPGLVVLTIALLTSHVAGAAKQHVITFGKWISVQWFAGTNDSKPLILKVRALIVDGRLKGYVLGSPHEVTERLFVVRQVSRINDSLPSEQGNPRWQWERGGWLLVDRMTGHISPVNLPEFDTFYSAETWFRDYVAYCGLSDDGKKVYAIVVQIGRRKPVMKNSLAGATVSDEGRPDSACAQPLWQRRPVRVSFEVSGGTRQTFAIRGHVVDLVNDPPEEEEGSR
jgi:hypothetical protein